MSRIGKKPITVPSGVKVSLEPASRTIRAEGPQGRLAYEWRPEVTVALEDGGRRVHCTLPEAHQNSRQARAYWGTVRARINNMIDGVSKGFRKDLEVVGVGWNAQAAGSKLKLNIGYCHPIEMTPPDGVKFQIAGQVITITGPDRQAVGQFAAVVRSKRPPEPYNGKGIKYSNEQIIRKEGKAFGS
ncbi:MAG: 50S ribosomal protein L6 [Phycisphaeraceae bacterium]|nr:50S ribosomal protein L6 [Phycisphaeraceae bacterium]